MDAIRKILVPTDFSAHANEAFRVAQVLARGLGAEVVLFHVAHLPAVAAEGGEFLANPGQEDAVNLWDRFRSLRPIDPGVRVEHEVIVDDRPWAGQILKVLDKLGCDLIVMGTHGHSWLKDCLVGSVTEEVVRRARCPVLVVKAPAPAPDSRTPEAAQASGREREATAGGVRK